MNGFISQKALRFSLIASACLLTGFVSGAHFESVPFASPFSKKEINYEKISWISHVFSSQNISLATVDYPSSDLANQEIKLADFHLENRRESFLSKRTSNGSRKFSHNPRTRTNLEKLGQLVAQLRDQKKQFDLFEDYRNASAKMQNQFVMAFNRPTVKSESVLIASSSAVPATTVKPNNKPAHEAKLVSKKSLKSDLSTQKMNTQTNPNPKKMPEVAIKSNPAPMVDPTYGVLTTPSRDEFAKAIVTKSSAELSDLQPVTKSQVLKNELKAKLAEQRIQSYVQSKSVSKPIQYATKNTVSKQPEGPTEDQIDHNNDVQNISQIERNNSNSLIGCKILPQVKFIRPMHGDVSESTQICATGNKWISKAWSDEGWTKAEFESYLPVLTYYPQMNSNKVLLLDQNAVALLAIRNGMQSAKGTGIILGTVPENYQVEFSGRGEEVQYFELNGKKYFAVLNAEPGAGVIEVNAEKNSADVASVFTPVIADTVTYLDLAKPITVSIPVKVIKGSEKNSADVAGLTVSISTQTQVQAKTNGSGLAMLRDVRMIPGYPVFVDVTSKLNEEKSYQYRYQLNKRTRAGVFVLKQYSERQVYHWFKQMKVGLSDQSGYIFGEYNRKRLDGFRKHYFARVQTLAEKTGLSPKNYSVLWDEKLSDQDPLEGDRPRYVAVQVPEGLAQAHFVNENGQILQTSLIPVSPRVINVVSE